jgi:uncharacterized protein (DUF1800 family)
MLTSLPASKWTFAAAAHLLNRAGFGGPPAEIERLHRLGRDGAVDSLVDYEKVADETPRPAWAKPDPERMERLRELQTLRRQLRSAPEAERADLERKVRDMQREEQRLQRERIIELRGWWLERMAKGPRPLQEKLTLFWHGHFATSAQKVRDAYFMWRQNETFRRHAAGNWLTLLTEVTQDPAMLIWLDQAQSRKEHPNENYARELMELFALGEGNYTERDISEAARALTGLALDRLRQESTYRPFLHDAGEKTVLGKTGPLKWKDVLNQVVDQPQAARFITEKLWKFLAGVDAPAPLVSALAKTFRDHGCQFTPVLRALLRSEEFYAEAVMRSQVKSPVQWLVSSVRILERPLPPPLFASNLLQNLGQDLFAPPSVKGWEGGLSWITTNNLLARYNYAEQLVYGTSQLNFNTDRPALRAMQGRLNRRANAGRPRPVEVHKLLNEQERRSKRGLLAALQKRLLQGPIKPAREAVLREYLDSQGELDDHDILETIRLLMSTPEFQLC